MSFIQRALLFVFVFSCKYLAAQEIDITFPAERAVFQRNNGNAAIIYVAGNFRTKLDRIEAKLEALQGGNSQDWVGLSNNPSHGIYRGSLVVTGGWYKLSVRGIYKGQVVAQNQISKFGVGEVFLISGQSNAQGYFGYGQPPAYDDRVNVINGSLYDFNQAPKYPTFSHLDAQTVIAPHGNGSWCWGKLGDLLAQRLNVPILFINAAWEGFQVSEFVNTIWGGSGINPYSKIRAPEGYPFRSIEESLHNYTNLTGLRSILWLQGESDTYLNTDFNSYAQNLNNLINATKSKTGKEISWVVARTSKDVFRTSQSIIDAQNFVINSNYNVFEGPYTDPIGKRVDGVHFSASGLSDLAYAWDASLNAQFFAHSTPNFGNPPLYVQGDCDRKEEARPMRLVAPQGYVSYNWSNGETNLETRTNWGYTSGFSRDIFGNVYFMAPVNYTEQLVPEKPQIAALGSTSFCEGQAVQLTTNNTYQNYWNIGYDATSIWANASGQYYVTHFNEYNCPSQSDFINVNVHPNPVPEIIASGPLEICSDQQLTLKSSLPNGVQWNTGDTQPELKVSSSGRYSLKAKSEFGCEGQSEAVEVTIKPAAQKPSVENIGPDVLCETDSTILRVSNAQNMRWNTGEQTIEKAVKRTGEYYAINTNEYGCEATSQRFNITVNPIPNKPTVEVLGSLEVCDDEEVTLKASPAYAYHWNNGFSDREVEVNISREIFLRTSNEYGCFSEPSEPKGVVILEKPKNPTILQTGTFTLKSVFSTDTTNLFYHWLIENDTISTSNAFIKARRSGEYQLIGEKYYQLSNGGAKSCFSVISEPYDFYITNESDGFSAYPNPVVNSRITIETLEDVDRATVSLFSLDGKPFFSEYVDVFDGPKTFDLSRLPMGKYILKVRNNRSRFYRKIMIEQP